MYCSGILGQAETLVDKMKNDKTIDFENDWKMVTLFIGGNDLCAFCKDEVIILKFICSFNEMLQ